MAKKHWLLKSEPESYSIQQFEKDKKTLWTGVHNYQARNFMMNDMSLGDEILFYHSNAEPPGIVGLGTVSGAAVPDPTALDKKSEYHDPKATREKPIWFCVEVQHKKTLPQPLTLEQIRAAKGLDDLELLRRGSRLSVQPVSAKHYQILLKLAGLA